MDFPNDSENVAFFEKDTWSESGDYCYFLNPATIILVGVVMVCLENIPGGI
jgi:hypothetical protein